MSEAREALWRGAPSSVKVANSGESVSAWLLLYELIVWDHGEFLEGRSDVGSVLGHICPHTISEVPIWIE